jgi:hypothetical protein
MVTSSSLFCIALMILQLMIAIPSSMAAESRGSGGVLRPKVDACLRMAWQKCQTKCIDNKNDHSAYDTCTNYVAMETCASLGIPVSQKKRFTTEVVNMAKAECVVFHSMDDEDDEDDDDDEEEEDLTISTF